MSKRAIMFLQKCQIIIRPESINMECDGESRSSLKVMKVLVLVFVRNFGVFA